MSWSRMAVKMLLRLASGGGHLRLERRLLEVAKPLELAEGQERRQVDRAGDLVDVAILELEGRGREQLGQKVFIGALGDLQPDGRAPLALAQGLLDRREQAAPDLVFLDRQVAVAGDAKGDALGRTIAAEEGVEPGADDVFQQDEPPLAVGFVGQRDQAVEDRRDLEHGVERPRVRLVGLDPQEQVQALVVHVRERMRRVDGQRRQDGVDLGVEIVVEERVLGGGQLLRRAEPDAVLDQERADLGVPRLVHAGDEVVRAAGDLDQLGQRAPCRRGVGPAARGFRRAEPGGRRRGPRRTRRGSTHRSPETAAARAAGWTGRAPLRAPAR